MNTDYTGGADEYASKALQLAESLAESGTVIDLARGVLKAGIAGGWGLLAVVGAVREVTEQLADMKASLDEIAGGTRDALAAEVDALGYPAVRATGANSAVPR